MGNAILERAGRAYFSEEPVNNQSPLSREMDYFRQNWQREGLPHNWAALPGTGFQMRGQLNLLFSELGNVDSLKRRQEKIEGWLGQTEEDIKGFILEYLAEGLVFPIYYEIKREEGRITAPFYADKDIENLVSSKERNGLVKQSVGKIKSFLLSDATPDGAIAVMTSPSGWSGLHDEEGNVITYPDSQTYIFQKNGTEIVGFTIRTDFSLEEHRELLRRLNFQDLLPQNATVSDYVENVVAIYSKNIDIRDVVDVMRDVRFNLSGGSVFAYKNRLWKEVYQDLKRREELWKIDEHTSRLVEEFRQLVLTQNWSKKDLQEALAVTILRIARLLRGARQKDTRQEFSRGLHERDFLPFDVSYGKVLSKVQEIPGCAGGGNKKTKLVNSLTSRFGETDVFNKEQEDDDEYRFDKDGTCDVCGKSSEEVGKLGPCYICAGCDKDLRRK